MSNHPGAADLWLRLSHIRPAVSLRDAWREGYSWAHLQADVTSGIVVGIVALPLSMALAIASGVPPQHGLYTAIFAGGLIAMLGGSRVQVSGPTAALVVILAPISAKFGLGGLALASVMGGFFLLAMGFARLGKLIAFIPYPVTLGFTAGIGVVIATLQIKDLLGLSIERMPDVYIHRVATLLYAVPTVQWPDLIIGLITLGVLVIWARYIRKVPAPLVGLTVGSLAALAMTQLWPGHDAMTIASQFGTEAAPAGIPPSLPMPGVPWHWGGPGGEPLVMSWQLVQDLLPASLAIAMLGAIASLLSAVVADGMTGFRHDPDVELMAQGAGNIVAPFFGAIAATGAIARTATNARFGGRSPIAALTHALFIVAAILFATPLLGYLPLASLAALLLIVAWNMSEVRHVVHLMRVAPRSDAAVLATCLVLTVLFDMAIAVGVGVVLAALLFMRRMADIADVRVFEESHHHVDEALPPGMAVYEVAGPLFFGAAQRAMATLERVGPHVHVILIDMRSIPVMDMTGLISLQSAIDRLARHHIFVILCGVQQQPLALLKKARVTEDRNHLAVAGTFDEGVAMGCMMTHLLPRAGEKAVPHAGA